MTIKHHVANKCFLVALSVWSVNTYAIEPDSCRNGFFPKKQNTLQLASVNIAKGEKLYFYSDEQGCPDTPSCQTKSYLIAGDKVIVNAVNEGWACAWFSGKKHETVGWLATKQLTFESNETTMPWSGQWQFYDNKIQFDNTDNKVYVQGDALWLGAIVAGEPVIHTGELNGLLEINGHHARLIDSEVDCIANFTLLADYLIVADNNNCGGANVSFNGVYRKTH